MAKCQNCPHDLGCTFECERPAPSITTNHTITPCPICNGGGMIGWEKPMSFPPTMVFVPQFCVCEAGQSLARMNAPDAKRTIISSMHDLPEIQE